MSDLRNVARHYRSERGLMGLSIAFAFAASLAEMGLLLVLVPLAQSIIGDSVDLATKLPFDDVGTPGLLGIACGLLVTSVVLRISSTWFSAKAAAQWQHHRRLELFAAFQAADWPTQTRDRAGKLIAVSGPNVNQGAAGLSAIATGLGACFGLAVMVSGAFLVSPAGAGLMLVAGAALIAVLRPLARWAKRLQRHLARLNVEIANEIGEWVSFAREVRLFGVAPQAEERVGRLVDEQERYRVTGVTLQQSLGPLYQFGGIMVVLGIIWVATLQDDLAAAGLATAALLLYRSLAYGQAVQRGLHTVSEVAPYLDDLDKDLATYRASVDAAGDRELAELTELRLEHVSYRYAPAQLALDDVDTRLHRGEIVGLVGPSGSGKSTLAQLLLRLRVPTEGRLLVDGSPVSELSLESWYRRVALVPQEAHLLHGSVAENIAFLRPDLDRAAVEAAAKAAGVHDEILALPHGYDTPVGPSDRDLSGGQVQRISIARALAGDPAVLVLDEPTSALDVHSEAVVQRTIESLRHRLLVVIIAHRLSTLSICDRLLVLRDGRLEHDGPPDVVTRDSSFFATGALDLA